MVCRGVKAGPARIRAAVQVGNGAGPSQPVVVRRQSHRIANPTERKEVKDARKFKEATYEAKGTGYNVRDLAALFTAVTGNPRITTAILQNRASGAVRNVSTAILAFADGLPNSNLVAANLGEYTATQEAWQHLLEAIRAPTSILGHLYITEPKTNSGLTGSQKKQMFAALRENRKKQGYKDRSDTNDKRAKMATARCWYNPKML